MYNHPPEGGKTLTELKTKIFNKIDMNMEFDETKENDKEYLKESIRDIICGDEPQMILTNDSSYF